MDQNDRTERAKQLRESVPGVNPVDANEKSPAASELDSFTEQDYAVEYANEEADLTGAAMAVHPFGSANTTGRDDQEAVRNVTGRRVVEPTAAQNEANREEEAIARRVLDGDTEAFSELIDRYKVAVYNLCARMLNSPEEAEDAAQEVFVRAYTQLHSYQPGRRFSTWLLSIASHYCIDLLRRRKPQVDLDTIAFWKQSEQPEPEETAMTGETRDEVRELLNKLPEKYRGVTVLRYWHDLSYDEIAEATGLSVATVKTRLFRARELLAKELERQRQNESQNGQPESKRARPRALVKRNNAVNSNAE
ncbi:MAG TPA: sigma-70 family RNA polymerase sigma factor [Chloroflexia bacterium]|nr:sigma-70 family RNA polymerase sigma factor [Chloroflexia bacterium]